MIDLTRWVLDTTNSLDALNGHVFRTWPQKRLGQKAVPTFAVVTALSRQPELTGPGGEEIITRLAYAVTLCTPTLAEQDAIATDLIDLYQSYNLMTTWANLGYDTDQGSYRAVLTLTGSVDKRGAVAP